MSIINNNIIELVRRSHLILHYKLKDLILHLQLADVSIVVLCPREYFSRSSHSCIPI